MQLFSTVINPAQLMTSREWIIQGYFIVCHLMSVVLIPFSILTIKSLTPRKENISLTCDDYTSLVLMPPFKYFLLSETVQIVGSAQAGIG